ncbi:crystallin [Neosynechococcus sphagnicola sy1]|uniref:Crystallin n=1 Tax=Neosynechococcus sphagnicola sy1 TaxID=1497020 RepID=A0A098THE5_9CYAN|nr:ADP-ribosylglycohydrolase family protein [Neosynechococcus sphagnicola]KGF71397.1 crystallin [Neosynechococcus sphagnicola sy1]
MLGAIVGDIVGSTYEGKIIRSKDFELFSSKSHFTDDTVLTIAVADSILNNDNNYTQSIKQYFNQYPRAGYGARFMLWGFSDSLEPYNSFGNGSAMRVSPIAYAFDDLETVLKEAERSASVTHNHPEGIKGAQAIAVAIFMARKKYSKPEIKAFIENTFNYDLSLELNTVEPAGVTCQRSVPQAVIAFLESTGFEDTIRNAIFIGGDSDTLACMAGGIAEAFYGGIPEPIAQQALLTLDSFLRSITERFLLKYQP